MTHATTQSDLENPSTISVVIPCHNCGTYLRDAVESVFRQSGPYDLTGVVIVDDHSDDPATLTILSELQGTDGIKVVRHSGQRGVGAARNAGIRASRGTWIAMLDGDDLMAPDSLRIRIETSRRFPGVGWIGGNWMAVDESGEPIPTSEAYPVKGRGIDAPPLREEYELVRAAFETAEPLRIFRPVQTFLRRSISVTHLIRKSLLLEVGLYDEALLACEDRDLYVRLARISDFVFVPEVLLYYRQHNENLTLDESRMLEGRLRLFKKLVSDGSFREYRGIIKTIAYEVAMTHAYYHRELHMHRRAVVSAVWAVILSPMKMVAWRNLLASMLGR